MINYDEVNFTERRSEEVSLDYIRNRIIGNYEPSFY